MKVERRRLIAINPEHWTDWESCDPQPRSIVWHNLRMASSWSDGAGNEYRRVP